MTSFKKNDMVAFKRSEGCIQNGRICEVNENSVDVLWVEKDEVFLKRIKKQNIQVLEKNSFWFLKCCSFRLIICLLLSSLFCNGLVHFYYQLEMKYYECLVEKESFIYTVFFTKKCEHRVSLFNAFFETICDICYSIGAAFGKTANGFFSELFNGMGIVDYVILWSYFYSICLLVSIPATLFFIFRKFGY